MKIRTILLGTVFGLAVAASPAEADPFTTAIAAAASWVGSTVAAGGIAGALLQTGIAMAASRLVTAVFGRRGQPDRKPGGIKTEVEQTGGTNPQTFILGKYATNGTRICPPMSHGTDNRYLTYVIGLSDLPIEPLTAVYVNGALTDFDDDDDVLLDAQGDLRGRCWMRFHDGRQTQADSWLLDTYGSYSKRPWQTDMVLPGMAYAIMVYRYDQEEYSGWPKARFQANGIDLYDPREDSSVGGSGSQRWDDPSTWWFSTNPQVMIYNILRGISLPDGSVWGLGAEAGDLPLDAWFAAMNACEEQVDDGEGGTEHRYRAGLEVSVDQEPWEVIEDLLTACGGDIVEVGGRFYTAVGAPEAPTYYLTDEDIVITEGRDFSPFPSLTQTFNGVSATYPDPGSNWESTEARPYYNAAWEAEDQGRRLVASLDLAAVPYPRQVRALMRELAKDNRRERTHVLTLPPDAMKLRPLHTISWTSEFNGYVDKLFEVTRAVLDPETLCRTVTIRERDPADYDPDAAFDAVRPTPPSRDLVIPTYEGIPGWDVYAVVIRDKLNRPRRVGIAMEWDPEVPADAIAWRIKVESNGDVADEGSMSDLRRGGTVRIADGIIPAETFTVEGRMIGAKNSIWTIPILVTTDDVGLIESDLALQIREKINTATNEAQTALEGFDALVGAIDGTITDQDASDAGVASVKLFSGDVNNFKTNFAGVTAATVNGNIAGFQAVSWDDPDGGGSTLKLIGNEVLIPGSVYMSNLTVTDLDNKVPDGNFAGGTLDPWVNTGAGTFAVGLRDPNSSGNAQSTAPTKHYVTAPAGGDAFLVNFLSDDRRLQVEPGQKFKLKLDIAGGGVAVDRKIYLQAQFVYPGGAQIEWRGISKVKTGTGWETIEGEITAPAGAGYIDAWRIVALDGSGTAVASKPYAYRMNAAELVVDGGITAAKIAAGAVNADKIQARVIDTEKLKIGGVLTDNIGNGSISGSASRNSPGSLYLTPKNGTNTYFMIHVSVITEVNRSGHMRVRHNGTEIYYVPFNGVPYTGTFVRTFDVSAKPGTNHFELETNDTRYESFAIHQMEK